MTGEITGLLGEFDGNDPAAQSKLMERLYPELRRIAEFRMRTERPDHTLQPTALVNEFFLKLARRGPLSYQSRSHFLATASEVMRKVLIDYARAHNSGKRGGHSVRVEFADLAPPPRGRTIDLIEIDELLRKLSLEEPRMARVVEMRLFGGLTYGEIGDALGLDERTAKRDWTVARAWLSGKLGIASSDVSRGLGEG